MFKGNIQEFLKMFEIKADINIDEMCGIHFKLTQIPKNVMVGDKPLKH